jgi:DNA polymerase I-like protein with 3'-5' exonuclease and polymerase domains
LETQSILDTELKKRVYPFYDIEQQVNGRLKGSKPFITAINTHNLTDAEKDKLKLRSEEEFFVYFDFNSMEVAVLQFLAQDERLKSMLLGDCYRNIWSELFHSNCDTAQQRKFIKDSFLPLIFGGGNVAIMEATGCSEKTVISLRNKLRDNFPKSFNFVENCQNLIVEDYFGRKREFSEDKLYIAKNFVIQAPAAIICMEKLIELYFIAGDKLLFSIHDGYVIRCNPKTDKPLIMECKKVLESPSKLAEGLQLTVTCQLGAKLNRMRSINV